MKFNFKEETPTDIDILIKKANNKQDASGRLDAISELGSWKCKESIDVLLRLMTNDKLFNIQHQAYLRLQAFGEKVKLPKKKKGKLVKDIEQKLKKILKSIETEIEFENFKQSFKEKYPEGFDLYFHDKEAGFDRWLKNVVIGFPKEIKCKISDL